MSPARPGELNPNNAAKRLGVHVKTVRRWCEAYVNGDPSPIGPVRVTGTGRYFIASESVSIEKVRAMQK